MEILPFFGNILYCLNAVFPQFCQKSPKTRSQSAWNFFDLIGHIKKSSILRFWSLLNSVLLKLNFTPPSLQKWWISQSKHQNVCTYFDIFIQQHFANVLYQNSKALCGKSITNKKQIFFIILNLGTFIFLEII